MSQQTTRKERGGQTAEVNHDEAACATLRSEKMRQVCKPPSWARVSISPVAVADALPLDDSRAVAWCCCVRWRRPPGGAGLSSSRGRNRTVMQFHRLRWTTRRRPSLQTRRLEPFASSLAVFPQSAQDPSDLFGERLMPILVDPAVAFGPHMTPFTLYITTG